ncbi:MAG: divergent PAP2 family protein [Nanoarchaeota archaeon]
MVLQLLSHPIVLPTLAAYGASLIGKIMTESFQRKSITFRHFLRDGGMPSSHTAIVVGFTTAVYLAEGATSVFWMAVLLSLIVMRDAMSVRYEAGRQGKVLNRIIRKLQIGETLGEKQFKELLGHTPTQVLVGLVLGILISWGTYVLLFS